jgi:5-methylcytosine-specific restriction endonuclease McrA
MERLFTEPQWRAVARIEELNEIRKWYHEHESEKRMFGPAFVGWDFCLCMELEGMAPNEMGPPGPMYSVWERLSCVQITGWVPDKIEAMSVARERVLLIGWDYLGPMLDSYRLAYRQHLAEEEASAAIRRAKAEAKATRKGKIGRRRRAIFEQANGKCHYCQTPIELGGDWHVDHRMPKALGGSDEEVNLVAACVPCNLAKKDKTDVEFFALLAAKAS